MHTYLLGTVVKGGQTNFNRSVHIVSFQHTYSRALVGQIGQYCTITAYYL